MEIFETLYDTFFGWLYGPDMYDFLRGYDATTGDFTQGSAFPSLWLCAIVLPLLSGLLYYKVVDNPRFASRGGWGATLGLNALFLLIVTLVWAWRAYESGDIPAEFNVGGGDLFGIAVAQALLGTLCFVLWSFFLRFISTSSRFIPW